MNFASGMAAGTDWLPWIAELALKASVLLLLTSAAAAMLWRASAATRHLVWCVGVAGVLALPLFSALLPAWQLPVLPASTVSTDAALPAGAPTVSWADDAAPAPRSSGSAQPRPTAREWLPGAAVAVVGFGMVAGLLWLAAGFWGVSRIGRRAEVVRDPEWLRSVHDAAERLGLRRPVLLLRSRAPVMPATWGLLWPTVVLPQAAEQWADDRRRAVLAHELAHVKRFDCLTQALAQVACALFWWHPGVWYAARRLRVERERACDDLVLGAGARPSEYAGHLLEIARMHRNLRLAAPAMVSMARPSHLESRLLWVLDAARVRTPPSLPATLLTVTVALLGVGPLAAMQPVARLVDLAVPHGPPATRAHAAAAAAALVERGSREARAEPAGAGAAEPDTSYAAQMRAAGYPDLTRRQLRVMRQAGVTGGYARQMNGAGLGRLTPSELLQLWQVRATAAYIEELRRHGLTSLAADQVHDLRHYGVDGPYIDEITETLGRMSADQMVSMRALNVTREYLRELAREGVTHVTASSAEELRVYGVTREYVAQVREAGLGSVRAEDIAEMRSAGVTPEDVRELAAVGRVSPGRLVELRAGAEARKQLQSAIANAVATAQAQARAAAETRVGETPRGQP